MCNYYILFNLRVGCIYTAIFEENAVYLKVGCARLYSLITYLPSKWQSNYYLSCHLMVINHEVNLKWSEIETDDHDSESESEMERAGEEGVKTKNKHFWFYVGIDGEIL